jgi:hypothetical protein
MPTREGGIAVEVKVEEEAAAGTVVVDETFPSGMLLTLIDDDDDDRFEEGGGGAATEEEEEEATPNKERIEIKCFSVSCSVSANASKETFPISNESIGKPVFPPLASAA